MATTSPSTDFFKDQLDDAHFRIAGLEEELAAKRKEIKRLERQVARYESEGVKTGLAEEIFALWVGLNGKNANTQLTPDRRKAITAALKLRGEARVRKVIAQNAKTPYLVYTAWRASGAEDSKRDLADILSKGKHFEALEKMADADEPKPATEEQMAQWHDQLFATEAVCDRLYALKGWTAATLETLGAGFDGKRIVFPVRDPQGELLGVVRYFPGEHRGSQPKSIAVGPRGMFPAPETIDGDMIWLVEGEADAVTAHEMWLPGVAIPGASTGPGKWMERLSGRKVVVCLDCDHAGRQCANRIARPLTQFAAEVKILDLDPGRADGYDLTDWFRAGRQRKTLEEMAKALKPVSSVQTPSLLPQQTRVFAPDPASADTRFGRFIRALEAKDCDPKELRGGQWRSLCPAHDDRVPTLYFRRGDSSPVIVDCKAGCSWEAISESLNHPTRGKE